MIVKLISFAWCVMMFGQTQRAACATEAPPPCDSEIYCHGRLLHTIQMARVNPDSKTFVDMKMKQSPNETLERFDIFMQTCNNVPTRDQVIGFIKENFDSEGEFETWVPKDWIKQPKFLDNINDHSLRQWGSVLNDKWKILGRQIKSEVQQNSELYSIIWVPNPVIVPGGRFREFYYWDSYWIIQGLLLSEMYTTAKGMLSNFLYIVDIYGHIPNGGRIYYLERSQPPLLIPMIKSYVDAVKDIKFVADNIEIMESEFDYWMTNHTRVVPYNGKNYTLAVYGDRSYGPRPESYSEDVEIADARFKEEHQKQAFYSELKAAAESGWDFSSRWFITNATNKGNLSNINTRSIVPTDLNALIYWNAVILAEFNQYLNNTDKVKKYNDIANEWMEAVTAVLWHEEVGAWLDYDLINNIKRDYFYPSNIAPLWTGCYPASERENMIRLVLKYLQTMKVMYPGGIPTTKEHTGEQWDFPNAWPPLQHMMVIGLYNTDNEAAHRLAFEIAELWIRSNYKAFNQTERMYEKYDATVPGGHGGGGEYEIQEGFGWTNGVIMDLLNKFGGSLHVDDLPVKEYSEARQTAVVSSPSTFGQVATGLLALIVSLTAGFVGISIYKRRTSASHAAGEFLKKRVPSRTQYTELRSIPKRSRNSR